MPMTPETLPRHELNGLRVAVVDAPNPDIVGIEGRVVVETMRTLHIESVAPDVRRDPESDAVEHVRGESRVRQVPKRGTTFEFALTDEAAEVETASGTASKLGSETAGGNAGQSGSCEGVAYVTVDGTRLLSRPALRTETTGDSKWR